MDRRAVDQVFRMKPFLYADLMNQTQVQINTCNESAYQLRFVAPSNVGLVAPRKRGQDGENALRGS